MSDSHERWHIAIQRLTKDLADKGLLLAAGWQSYRLMTFGPDSPVKEQDAQKFAFYAGAQHVFASMLNMLDEDHEPTDADMARMTHLNQELKEFELQFKARSAAAMRNKGSA